MRFRSGASKARLRRPTFTCASLPAPTSRSNRLAGGLERPSDQRCRVGCGEHRCGGQDLDGTGVPSNRGECGRRARARATTARAPDVRNRSHPRSLGGMPRRRARPSGWFPHVLWRCPVGRPDASGSGRRCNLADQAASRRDTGGGTRCPSPRRRSTSGISLRRMSPDSEET